MVGLVRINEERTKGLAAYSFDQFKILSFVYGGNLDYYVVADIYPNGTLESDKSLAFILDKSDIELYNTFNVFFNYVKTISLRLKSGSRKICLPPNKYKLECHNAYDIEELYDADNNQIKWPSEAGCGLNKDTVMFVRQCDGQYKFIFENDELSRINERRTRVVCICNSGSRSVIFPYLFSGFFQELKKLQATISQSEAETKILRK